MLDEGVEAVGIGMEIGLEIELVGRIHWPAFSWNVSDRGICRSFLRLRFSSVEIAGIGAEGFLGGALAEAEGLQVAQDLFAEVHRVTRWSLRLTVASWTRRMLGDLEEGSPIEVVGGEEEAIFGRLALRRGDCWTARLRRSSWAGAAGSGCGEGRVAGGGFEGLFAPGLAVVVYVALGEGGAQPAEERSAALVGVERGSGAAPSRSRRGW
jgi:hypothetical protein